MSDREVDNHSAKLKSQGRVSTTPLTFSDQEIVVSRGPKNAIDPLRPYHSLVEPEYSADGIVEDVATIFLSNRECSFRCLMCDLWRNTTDQRVPAGAITEQIRFALKLLPAAQHIKLYNSGNFFDSQAIPHDDLPEIAARVRHFRTVIVENHPKLVNARCFEFQDLCETQLEVAMGLETSHEPTLQTLNKQMTTADFARACDRLLSGGVRVRAFILLRPPGTTEQQGIERAVESVRFAFACGVDCCCVIPTRSGNGIMDQLQNAGVFSSPTLTSLETVLDETIGWNRGRVFADLWDAEQFGSCQFCVDDRMNRLQKMNLTQIVARSAKCSACGPGLARDDG